MNQIENQDSSSSKIVTPEPGSSWSDAEMRTLYNLRNAGYPYSLIAIEIKRSENACRKKYRNTLWQSTPYPNKIEDMLEEKKKEVLIEKMASSLDKKREIFKLKADILADRLSASVKALPTAPPKIYIPKRRIEEQHSEHMGLILSDSHIGLDFTSEETGGLSQYNVSVFEQRAENLKKGLADIWRLHAELYDVPVLHIFCLGDIVAGMNEAGEWSGAYINLAISNQMVKGWQAMENMIYSWLGIFKKIYFYGVRGNHGRAAPKNVERDYVNWDHVCYEFLAARFGNNDRVEFVIPNTWWILRTIKQHNFLMVHGDDLKKRSGTTLRTLQEFEQKMIGITRKVPNYTLVGHFHNAGDLSTNNGRLLINGSFVGADVYALKDIHAMSRPQQKVFGIHDRHGITWSYNLDLD